MLLCLGFGLHKLEGHIELDFILIIPHLASVGQVAELLCILLEFLRSSLLGLVVLNLGVEFFAIDLSLRGSVVGVWFHFLFFLVKLAELVALGVLHVEVDDLGEDGRGNHLLTLVDWVVAVAVAAITVEVRLRKLSAAHSLEHVDDLIITKSTFFGELWDELRENLVGESHVDGTESILVDGSVDDHEHIGLRWHVPKVFTELNIVLLKVVLVPVVSFAVIGSNKHRHSAYILLEGLLAIGVVAARSEAFVIHAPETRRVLE